MEVDLAAGRVAERRGDGGHRSREPAVGGGAPAAGSGVDCTRGSLPVGRGEIPGRAHFPSAERPRGPDRCRGARRRRRPSTTPRCGAASGSSACCGRCGVAARPSRGGGAAGGASGPTADALVDAGRAAAWGPCAGVGEVKVELGVMTDDERAGAPSPSWRSGRGRARRSGRTARPGHTHGAPDGPPATARARGGPAQPVHGAGIAHPGGGDLVGQGWGRQVVGDGEPGGGPGGVGPMTSGCSTPTSTGSRSRRCSG